MLRSGVGGIYRAGPGTCFYSSGSEREVDGVGNIVLDRTGVGGEYDSEKVELYCFRFRGGGIVRELKKRGEGVGELRG